jgi:hypothetical protein
MRQFRPNGHHIFEQRRDAIATPNRLSGRTWPAGRHSMPNRKPVSAPNARGKPDLLDSLWAARSILSTLQARPACGAPALSLVDGAAHLYASELAMQHGAATTSRPAPGWQCPGCSKVYSPVTVECLACNGAPARADELRYPPALRKPFVRSSEPLPGWRAYGNAH